MMKILNFKLVILLEYQNMKIFLQKDMLEIGQKKFLLLQKLQTLCNGHMLLAILNAKKFTKSFTKKNSKKNQKEFRVDHVIKRKDDKLGVKWKG